ncbi:MAG TPA: phosphoglycerate dehydrogenase [Xanthobacteraceae bacterium]|jgi:D-3-phosphoglycerate dehydrogenase / 2-oxoglutarate reductase|nr:phosphoglycerate dehydrogenase [Xanthobacteraceae bacterium]
MAPRVLITDALSPAAVAIFKNRGLDVDFQPNLGKDKDKLAATINGFDGLAIRSATKVTGKLLEQAKGLKVIGRAGIGVDNVDIAAATARGIIVMNTPFGNSITTAEHAITLMLALARQIPEADTSTRAGKWEKNKFLGVEIFGKTLGIIGCGNVGSIVADRAIGLKMKVIAYDPFLSTERALKLGVEKVELDELWRRADFITLHTPLTDKTRNIVNAETLSQMKRGVRLINCARGELVDDAALGAALKSGHVAGAALDVFREEPATQSVLFGLPNVVCTPHLGASTMEAQENVALQIAEQMSDYLLRGAITNAVNFPSISAEEAPKLKPFIALAEKLGSFAGQLTESGIKQVQITYEGVVAQMNTKALTSAAVAGLLRPMLQEVNVVSAPIVAKDRGIVVEETRRDTEGDFDSLITLAVVTDRQRRSVSGTVFADGRPRIVDIKGIRMDAEFAPSMLYVTNQDKPGFIGRFATLLGEAGINIATFHLGRESEGGNAIALVEIDGSVPAEVLDKVRHIPNVQQVKPLQF